MENINVSFPDDGLGDKVRNAFIKVNDNFDELLSDLILKIYDAPADGKKYVRKDNAWVEFTGGGGGETTYPIITSVNLSMFK